MYTFYGFILYRTPFRLCATQSDLDSIHKGAHDWILVTIIVALKLILVSQWGRKFVHFKYPPTTHLWVGWGWGCCGEEAYIACLERFCDEVIQRLVYRISRKSVKTVCFARTNWQTIYWNAFRSWKKFNFDYDFTDVFPWGSSWQ